MNTDAVAREIAQEGLRQIEEAMLQLLENNPQGLRNSEIADLLNLRSDFRGGQRNYLTYSVLGGLLASGKLHGIRKPKFSPKSESHQLSSAPQGPARTPRPCIPVAS